MRLLVDTSSLLWRALLVGKDTENGKTVEHEGKTLYVNSADYGLDNAIASMVATMREVGAVPSDVIFVTEGAQSLARRKALLPTYKSGRSSRCPEQYEVFNTCRDTLLTTFRNLGSQTAECGGCEADDVLAFLAQTLPGDVTILTEDGDLSALINERVSLWRKGARLSTNPYGPFPTNRVTLMKALVGDTSDAIPGARGFGEKAFLDMLAAFDDNGLAALEGMIQRRVLHELADDVADFKPFRKVIDAADTVYASYEVAKLRPEWVDTLRQPLVWQPGMVLPCTDSRLKQWGQQVRLVTAGNFEAAYSFLKSKLDESRFFCLDLETTVPPESDEWLAERSSKGGGVDVIASTIVGCGITFGNNQQYGFYCSVDHADTDNISLTQLRQMLELFPAEKITVAHNAAGFELPVLYKALGAEWKGNGWRGFFPNMVDSRIAASYWNENAPSHGLKQLSLSLLGYEQETYEHVTGGKKMHELTAAHVLSYGLDDVFCTVGIWNFFKTVMEIEKSYDAFIRVEQKPMYLSALSYVQGTPVSLERLATLKKADEEAYRAHEKVLNAYLVSQGWAGTRCPVITELTAAAIKEAVFIILGQSLDTAVRTPSKLAKMVEVMEHDDAPMLAQFIEDGNIAQLNDWMSRRFDGTPDLNVGSNKQLVKLMYETMGLPIRLRNKATDAMRKAGIREGNPRADDDAMMMAIKMNDASPEVAPVLEALTAMKSINTKMGLYWEAYPNMVHWSDRKLHPELRQCATTTRRHTSGQPNIQQLDSDYGGVRSVIMPHHKNAVIVSCDLAGQEIRLLADMSRDPNMMSAYMGDDLKDLHSFTAAMILGISYEEFRARYKSSDEAVASAANEARQVGKTTFFASSYGAMAPKIAEGLGVDESVAEGYLKALDRAFPRVNEWKRETEDFASKHGWVPIHGGAPRHLRELILSDDKWLAQKALRQASNARIQGSGGYQLRTIMSMVWDSDLIDAYDFRFYWPVHDEAVFSVGRQDAVAAIQKFHGIMCSQFLDVLPSASSIGIGSSFGTLTEIGEVPDAYLISKTVEAIFNPPVLVTEESNA